MPSWLHNIPSCCALCLLSYSKTVSASKWHHTLHWWRISTLCVSHSQLPQIFTAFYFYCCTSDIPDTGLLCDLLWADPDKDIVGWGENDRGVSFTFGEDVVMQFLRRWEWIRREGKGPFHHQMTFLLVMLCHAMPCHADCFSQCSLDSLDITSDGSVNWYQYRM